MKKNVIFRNLSLCVVMVLIASMVSMPVGAQTPSQPDGATAVETMTAEIGAPVLEQAELLKEPPALSAEQAAQLEWGVENSNRSIAVDKSVAYDVAGPNPGTESVVQESRPRSGAPLAPGDPQTYQWTAFGGSIPAGYKSNVMESSVDGKSRKLFFTGNWFAANSVNKGIAWTYLSAFTGFPEFCCDQVIIHDIARDIYLWLRMGSADASGQNVFKLSVAFNSPFTGGYWTYVTAPTNTNAGWTNQWWDYPHIQLGADYLYLTWNMFDWNGTAGTGDDFWVRSVVLKWPLDALAAGAGFGYSYYANSDWFTFVPVSGASHIMYFASNWDMYPPYDSLAIFRWYEEAGLAVWVKTVDAWTATGRGDMHCGVPNWLARGDMRLLTGARYEINNDGVAGNPRQPGRKILGWWWNVAEGGGFSYPYVDAAAFYEDTMVQVVGWLGKPLIYGSYCFAYPSMAPNHRGDLGAVFNYSTSAAYQKPNVAYSIADDYWGAPPGWMVQGAAGSGAGPSDTKWGDYNTVRAYQSGTTWLAGSHYIPGAANCSNCSVPLFFSFGRERDGVNFRYW